MYYAGASLSYGQCYLLYSLLQLHCTTPLSRSLGQSQYRTGKASEMLFRAAEGSPTDLLSQGLLAQDGEPMLEEAAREDKAMLFGLEY